MHDQELLRRAQYDQDNGPPDNLYVIPADHAPSASPGAVNNFPAFSRRLRTIRYPKDFKPSIEKYDDRSDPSICVTTPPEIIPYYRLNHSIWSLSDNKEVSH
jgi:hypothetical protein